MLGSCSRDRSHWPIAQDNILQVSGLNDTLAQVHDAPAVVVFPASNKAITYTIPPQRKTL